MSNLDGTMFIFELYDLIVGRESINYKTQKAVQILVAKVVEDISCDLGMYENQYRVKSSHEFCEEYARSYERYIHRIAEGILANDFDYWDQRTKNYLMNLTHRKLGKNFNKLIYRRIYKPHFEF